LVNLKYPDHLNAFWMSVKGYAAPFLKRSMDTVSLKIVTNYKAVVGGTAMVAPLFRLIMKYK